MGSAGDDQTPRWRPLGRGGTSSEGTRIHERRRDSEWGSVGEHGHATRMLTEGPETAGSCEAAWRRARADVDSGARGATSRSGFGALKTGWMTLTGSSDEGTGVTGAGEAAMPANLSSGGAHLADLVMKLEGGGEL